MGARRVPSSEVAGVHRLLQAGSQVIREAPPSFLALPLSVLLRRLPSQLVHHEDDRAHFAQLNAGHSGGACSACDSSLVDSPQGPVRPQISGLAEAWRSPLSRARDLAARQHRVCEGQVGGHPMVSTSSASW